MFDPARVFTAKAISLESLLRQPGQCFYVPAYQREYAWDDEKVDRLLSDIASGVVQLIDNDDAVTFLGTLIAIHDTSHTTIEPQVVGMVPARVLTIIDGQQRLTTISLLLAGVYNELSERFGPKSHFTPELASFFSQHCNSLKPLLGQMLEDDQLVGEAQYYPKIIRAYRDSWSQSPLTMKYESPIASFLHHFGEWSRTDQHQKFEYFDDEVIRQRFGRIKKILRSEIACADADSEVQIPPTSVLLGSKTLISDLFQGGIPDTVKTELIKAGDDSRESELFNIIVFARFLINRVAVTLVSANSEEYAFDMFESLNTTGEPLTAFETLKPRVIRAEEHAKYQGSPSKVSMDSTDRYLNRHSGSKRIKATEDLVISFAGMNDGEKLSKRLYSQRRYLSRSYSKLDGKIDEQREFVDDLAVLAGVYDSFWSPVAPHLPKLEKVSFLDEQRLYIEILRATNHSIILPALARMYSEVLKGKISASELSGALRSFVGFLILWRAYTGGTGRIDDQYRKLMKEKFSREIADVVSLAGLNEFFRENLKKIDTDLPGDLTRADWVQRSKATPIYSNNRFITRAMLLVATHDSVPDPSEPGLIKTGMDHVLPTLSIKVWEGAEALTVEHVAPQTQTPEWDRKIYESGEMVHCLGNLALVPQGANSGLSNLNWKTKRWCFRILAATSIEERDSLIAAARSEKHVIPPSVASSSTFKLFTASLANLDEEWNSEFVTKRSERLCELVWDRVYSWIE
jgi:hypothetical protein